MQIDVIIDTICPWCYIGQARLSRALAARPDLDVVFAWRPFQIDPRMPPEGKERAGYMEARLGGPRRAQRHNRALERSGRQEGIEFRFGAIRRTPNTLESHRSIAYAVRFGLGAEMVGRLFRAYFVEGRDIGDRPTLASLGGELGLDERTLAAYLASDEDRDRLIAEAAHARLLGVGGVPCYVIAGRYAVSGAQSPKVLLQVLDLARQDGAVQAAE